MPWPFGKKESDEMGEAKIRENAKIEEMSKRPNDFIDIRECLLAVKVIVKDGKKYYPTMNNCRSIEDVVWARYQSNDSLDIREGEIKYQIMQKKKQGIVVAQPSQVNQVLQGKNGGR